MKIGTKPPAKPSFFMWGCALSAIWGCATLMLALCIPLASVTHSGVLLPLVTLAVAIAGTAVVAWALPRNARREQATLAQLEAATQQRLTELEERVANVEVIERFNQRLAEKAAAGESGAVPANEFAARKERRPTPMKE